MASKCFRAVGMVAAVLIGWPSMSLSAPDGRSAETGPSYPRALETAYEWRYSCPSERGCSFNCRGSGASDVTKLAIHLGSINLGTQNVAGVFYEFSTKYISRSNGFIITTGISTLSCQVNGMN